MSARLRVVPHEGDDPGEALLAYPENAKYRTNPGLIHPGDIVRVK